MANFNTVDCKNAIGANNKKYCREGKRLCFPNRCQDHVVTELKIK